MSLLTPSLDIVSPGERIEKMLESKWVTATVILILRLY